MRISGIWAFLVVSSIPIILLSINILILILVSYSFTLIYKPVLYENKFWISKYLNKIYLPSLISFLCSINGGFFFWKKRFIFN